MVGIDFVESSMKLHRYILILFVLLYLYPVTLAQVKNKTNPALQKPYWLNHNLIFLPSANHLPRILPNNIVFTEGCGDDARSGDILWKGTKIEIASISKEKGFKKMTFIAEGKKYQLLLKSGSENEYRKAFNLVFSEKEIDDESESACSSDLRTKEQVINCLGFPISKCKKGDLEQYYYILEFLGPRNPFGGYDGFWVEIKKGKVVNIYGYI